MNDDQKQNDTQAAEVKLDADSQEPENIQPQEVVEETNAAGDSEEVSFGEAAANEVSEDAPKDTELAGPAESENQEPETQEDTNEEVVTSETEAADTADATDSADVPTDTPKNDVPGARWYVVHTYSGHENRVATTLKQKVETERLEDKIVDILVPTQDKIEIKGGKKALVKEKIFPGYILVKMVLDDNSWLAVRTTQGVTSFVGIGNKPTPISDQEVATIIKFTKEEAPTFKQVFSVSDTVKIVDGPFAEFIGKVDGVDEEKGKVKVLVSIFGRETPVELDFLQVQKI